MAAPTPQPVTDEQPADKPKEGSETFTQFVKRKAKPSLAALVGNAFHVKVDGSYLTLSFDRAHANLIPMLKVAANFQLLQELAERFYDRKLELFFSVGNDPKIKQQQKREAEVLEIVKSDPKVKFVLDRFKGVIVSCQEMDATKE